MRKTNQRTPRCFLGSLPSGAHDGWRKLSCSAVDAIEDASPLRSFYEPGEFDEFVRDLDRSDIAVLPDIAALDERPTDRGLKPGVAYWLRLTRVLSTCAYVLDVATDTTSRDGQQWDDRVLHAHGQITKRRDLDSTVASTMNKARYKTEPGVVAMYRSRPFAAQREQVRVLWTSRAYRNVTEALEAIGVAFADLNCVSDQTIERITGVGRTGKPSARAKR